MRPQTITSVMPTMQINHYTTEKPSTSTALPTLLYVDNDPIQLQYVMGFLDEHPEQLLYAPNGQKAYEVAQRLQPDLIIMDWAMPGLSGLETLKLLKENEHTMHIPVIMCSAINSQSETLKEAMDAGAADFLAKPFDHAEFNARVAATLRHAHTVQNLQQRTLIREKALKQTMLQSQRQQKALSTLQHQLNTLAQMADGPLATQVLIMQRQLNKVAELPD